MYSHLDVLWFETDTLSTWSLTGLHVKYEIVHSIVILLFLNGWWVYPSQRDPTSVSWLKWFESTFMSSIRIQYGLREARMMSVEAGKIEIQSLRHVSELDKSVVWLLVQLEAHMHRLVKALHWCAAIDTLCLGSVWETMLVGSGSHINTVPHANDFIIPYALVTVV